MRQKIISFELPEDSIYKLTKVKAIEYSVFVVEGQKVIGTLISNPVKLGQRCIVTDSLSDLISTSWVKNIKIDKVNPRKLILKTENSIYELEELDEKKTP